MLASVQNKYTEDPAFSDIVSNPKEYKNFELMEDQLLYLKTNDSKVLCIPLVMVSGQNIREIVILEAHSLIAHLEARKMLTYLRNHVWWKGISSDIHAYCESCVVCCQNKPSNQ